jgi:hypothetical protein
MKEKIVFVLYKDKELKSVKKFENTIQKKYGFIPSKELSRKIINYQVKKYGHSLDGGDGIERTKWQCLKNKNRRDREKERDSRRKKEKAYLDKLERKNSKYTIEKDKVLKQWILWERDGSLKIERYRSKYAKECKIKLRGMK